MLPPRPAATIDLATRWVHRITWSKLARRRAFQPRSSLSRNGAAKVPPALLIRIVGQPRRSVVSAKAASTWSASRTSTTKPSPLISSPAALAVSGSFSQTATREPKLASVRATPRPIPVPPPVTTATRPSRRNESGESGAEESHSTVRTLRP